MNRTKLPKHCSTYRHKKPHKHVNLQRKALRHPSAYFSTNAGSVASKSLAVFPTMTTPDANHLSFVQEHKSYQTELSHGRLLSADQFLTRIDNIFRNIPMPSIQTELNLKRAQLGVYQSKFDESINSLEKNLQILSISLPFNNTNTAIDIPMSPALSYPKVAFTSLHDETNQDATQNVNNLIVSRIHTGYSETPMERTYLPIITSLIMLYVITGKFEKADKLLETWLPQFKDSSTPGKKSTLGTVLLTSLQGLTKQTQLSHKIRHFICNNDMKQFITNDVPIVEKAHVPKQRPRFVLKTTSVKTGEATTTPNDISTEQSQKKDADAAQFESNDEILVKKQKDQESMIDSLSKPPDIVPKQRDQETKPTFSLPSELTTLLTNSTYNINTDQIIDSSLILELESLPINDDHVTLFKSALHSYADAMNTVISDDSIPVHIKTLHRTDIMTHIVSLFNVYKPVMMNLQRHGSVLEQYLREINKLQSNYMLYNILGYETLPIIPNISPPTITEKTEKISPIHITHAGPRLLTSNMSQQSNSLILLNASLKVADILPNLANYVNSAENITHFTNIDGTKGTYLSPLLSAISTEYLSLNPVTAEGLIRTAIKYVEKEPPTHSIKQLLIDLYINNAFIASNLTWNGKSRTREAISLAFTAMKMLNEHNSGNSSLERLQPRYWDVHVRQKYNIRNEIKNNNDAMTDIETNPDNINDYEIFFKPLPPHNEQWAFDKYAY